MTTLTRRHAALACLLGLLATPAPAETGKRKSGAKSKPKSKSKTPGQPRSGAGSRGVRLKPSPVATYANGQTPAERQREEDARLRRECSGRPNAGACQGYTR